MECVYILHFDQPYKHARHYVGWTASFERRIEHHRNGSGARLLRALKLVGISFQVARVFDGKDGNFERKLHNTHKTAQYCPICNPHSREYQPKG